MRGVDQFPLRVPNGKVGLYHAILVDSHTFSFGNNQFANAWSYGFAVFGAAPLDLGNSLMASNSTSKTRSPAG